MTFYFTLLKIRFAMKKRLKEMERGEEQELKELFMNLKKRSVFYSIYGIHNATSANAFSRKVKIRFASIYFTTFNMFPYLFYLRGLLKALY